LAAPQGFDSRYAGPLVTAYLPIIVATLIRFDTFDSFNIFNIAWLRRFQLPVNFVLKIQSLTIF